MADSFPSCSVARRALKPLQASVLLLISFLSVSSRADDRQCTEWRAGAAGSQGINLEPGASRATVIESASALVFGRITRWSPWSLMNIAFTGFIESGRAWFDDTDADTQKHEHQKDTKQ